MLTNADVTDKTFTPTRLREGYEMAEVNEFVADVQETLALREKEIGDLRTKLESANAGGTFTVDSPAPARTGDQVRDSSVAAARLLEIATVNADQLVADAEAEAAALVAAATAEAERVTAELDRHRQTVLAEVAERKATLESTVEGLQRLEAESRDRLRTFFTEQLDQLEGSVEPVGPVAVD